MGALIRRLHAAGRPRSIGRALRTSSRIADAGVNQELIVRSHEHAIVTALQESKVDQLGDIRVHVLVVTPQGLGELANIKPLVRRNVA
jgi:hypothetical protein